MALSNTLGSYADIRTIFESVLAHGETELSFTTNGAAVHFRQRAYKFRRLMQNRGDTRYDGFMIERVGETGMRIRPEPITRGLTQVNFVHKPNAELVKFTPEPEPEDETDDELLSAALKLSLDLDDESN